MRASPSAQNPSQLVPAFYPSPFGSGSGRGPESRASPLRYLCRRSLSSALTFIQAGALNQKDPSGQVGRLNKTENIFRTSRQKFFLVLCSVVIALQPITVLGQRDKRFRTATVTVNFKPGHPANRFTPAHALGAAVDGHDQGVIDLQLTAPNIQAMLSAGFKSLGYRLRTELANDAWHWNSYGKWSDANYSQGYWTSDSNSA